MNDRKVAVIDVGSNTIKVLVAQLTSDGLIAVHQENAPTRIGSGMGSSRPLLSEENAKAGLQSVSQLLDTAKTYNAKPIRVVATGAVRDATNGKDFARQVETATGQRLAILSGEEEANGIALGILTDPALQKQKDFVACDLGGASLELVLVENRSPKATASLPLGAVRLTERFINCPNQPVSTAEIKELSRTVRETLSASPFPVPDKIPLLVATGGAFFTARGILAERKGIAFEADAQIKRDELEGLLAESASLNLVERQARFPKLPANRADIMIAAFACINAVLDHFKADAATNSLRNLRYGIASELLSQG